MKNHGSAIVACLAGFQIIVPAHAQPGGASDNSMGMQIANSGAPNEGAGGSEPGHGGPDNRGGTR